jgi:hypothetical protein
MLLRLTAAVAVAVAGFAAFALYESRWLGLFPLGEVPPKWDSYHALRTAFALSLSILMAALAYRGRQADAPIEREGMNASGMAAAAAVLALAAGACLLFLLDLRDFAAGAEEDSAVEWASALLLLLGSALVAVTAWSWLRRGDRRGAALAAAFALLFFVTGMEEISWMQRVFGFGTPPELARANMQGEFNLHNVHTDLSENVYYLGASALLILLPFLRDAVPPSGRLGWVEAFLLRRWVAAAAAPMAMFNYGMWNVIPMQMTFYLTVVLALLWAAAAHRRGDHAESALFAALALAVAAGQALFLSRSHLLPNVWDPSEYKELFVALGLACFAADLWLRARRPSAARS